VPAEALDQTVAPIALYPDSLVAQVLAASQFPAQIAAAQTWMDHHRGPPAATLAQQVNAQPWDPSVKALTQFPAVLQNMARNLSWTTALGTDYAQEPQAVLAAVQTMRARAEQAGTLRSTSQLAVSNQGPNIVIAPVDPAVVYVPAYDPWVVYGPPLAVYPGWVPVPGVFYDGPGLVFGIGIGIAAFAAFGWGWHHWGADWGGRAVVFNDRPFFANRASFAHGGPAGRFGRPGGFAGPRPGFGARPAFAANRPGFVGRPGGGFRSPVAAHPGPGGFHGGGFHGGVFHGGGFHGGGFQGGERR
jgi:hypothetical protein